MGRHACRTQLRKKSADYSPMSDSDSNIMLMGIEPSYPSEKYGYIIPETEESISKVKEFKEKPSEAVAREYIAQGALWNP